MPSFIHKLICFALALSVASTTIVNRDQNIAGVVQNNAAVGNATQGNIINVVGNQDSGNSGTISSTGIVQNNAAGNNAAQANQVNIVGQQSSSSSSSATGVISNNAADKNAAQGNSVNIVGGSQKTSGTSSSSGAVSQNETIGKPPSKNPSSSDGSGAQSSNSNAVVSGNNVSGGIQENSSTNQINSGANQTILGSIQDSHDIYNDHRNVTVFSKTDVNQTYFQNSMTNITENSYTNNSRLVNVVNNYNYSIVNPVQVMNYSYGIQASQSQNEDSRQNKPAFPSSYILSASSPRFEVSYTLLLTIVLLNKVF
jgi:hypothetical protein